MISRINRIQHKPTRIAIKIIGLLHLLYIKLFLVKLIAFYSVSLGALVVQSSFLMAALSLVPGFTFADELDTVDYSISNTTYPINARQGDIVAFMYYYQNIASIPGQGVSIVSELPMGMTYHSSSMIPTQINNRTVTWNISDVANNNGMILVRAKVNNTAYGIQTNTISIMSDSPDADISNNTASTSILIVDPQLFGDVDLSLDQDISLSEADISQELLYTLTYTHQGNDEAEGVRVYNMFPPSLSIIDTVPVASVISESDGIYWWNLGNVSTGETGVITVRASLSPLLNSGDVLVTHAIIDSLVSEDNQENNISETSVVVKNWEPDPYVYLFATDDAFCIGDTIQYTIDFGNNGLVDIDNVSMRFMFPTWMSFDSSSVYPSVIDWQSLIWNLSKNLLPWDMDFLTVDMSIDAITDDSDFLALASLYTNDQILQSGSFIIDMLSDINCQNNVLPSTPTPVLPSTPTPVLPSTPTPVLPSTPTPSFSTGVLPSIRTWIVRTWRISTGVIRTGLVSTASLIQDVVPFVDDIVVSENVFPIPVESTTSSDRSTSRPSSSWLGNVRNRWSGSSSFPSLTPSVFRPVSPVLSVNSFIENISDDNSTGFILCQSYEDLKELYDYALEVWITSAPRVEEADLCQPIERKYVSKMLVEYLLHLSIPDPRLQRKCNFSDIAWESNEIQFYIQLSCNFGLMGVDEKGKALDFFRPNDFVTRAEIAKALSSLLFGDAYNASDNEVWYKGHLQALHDSYVMRSIDNPTEQMTKRNIILLLQRIHLGQLTWNTKYMRYK
jgi:uncharacterized repeat protein (TIGR01451 family)